MNNNDFILLQIVTVTFFKKKTAHCSFYPIFLKSHSDLWCKLSLTVMFKQSVPHQLCYVSYCLVVIEN